MKLTRDGSKITVQDGAEILTALVPVYKDPPPVPPDTYTLEEAWTSPDWAIEKKPAGVACRAYLGSLCYFNPRDLELWDLFPEGEAYQLEWILTPMPDYDGTQVDGVIVSNKGPVLDWLRRDPGTSFLAQKEAGYPLRFVLTEIFKYRGLDVRDKPYKYRRDLLREVAILWQSRVKDPEWIIMNASVTDHKKDFYWSFWAKPGDEFYLKHIGGQYNAAQLQVPDPPGPAVEAITNLTTALAPLLNPPEPVPAPWIPEQRGRRSRIWTHEDGTEEYVLLVRRGDRNSRISRENGLEEMVPNDQLRTTD